MHPFKSKRRGATVGLGAVVPIAGRPLARAALCLAVLLALLSPLEAGPFDCSVVYDEFDSLMNKNFLVKPEAYVRVVRERLSRQDYNASQKGLLLLRPGREGWGVAVVHTNDNKWGKFLFTWGGRQDARGVPLLILRDITLYGKVEDGSHRKVTREIRLSASQQVDLDTGLANEGTEADVWFRVLEGSNVFLEAVNGAQITFPMETLCK